MMKKGLLSLSFFVSLLGGVNSYAQSVTSAKSDDGKTVTITVTGDNTSTSNLATTFAEAVKGCTKVVVTGGGTITNEAVNAIQYSNYAMNTTVTSLDLGGVTVKDFGIKSFYFSDTSWGSYAGASSTSLSIEELVLPQTDATEKTVPSKIYHNGNSTTTLKVKKITVPEGYTKIADEAFVNLSSLEEISLPSTLKTIGKKAFHSCSSLKEFIAPANLETIESEAFCMGGGQSKNPQIVKFNTGLKYIGNSAFAVNSTQSTEARKQSTIIIPSTVEYVGPFAFTGRAYDDVYYLGEQAPIEPMGKSTCTNFSDHGDGTAFDRSVYMGNSSVSLNATEGTIMGEISKEGEGNRLNYSLGGHYYTMLHFRSDLSVDQKNTFTDQTRVYKTNGKAGQTDWNTADNLKDPVGEETETLSVENGAYTALTTVTTGYEDTYKGVKYVWPSQSQLVRSYVVNTLGYQWNGVTKYRPTLTDTQKDYIKNEPGIENASSLTDDDMSLMAYLGTRRHVFISPDVQGSSTDYTISGVSKEHWWTICLPVSLTKTQVDDIFGAGTQVCLFSKVERSTKDGDKHLHLYFQKDTYRNIYTKATDGTYGEAGAETKDDDIVITANEAYMIYPTKDPEAGDRIIKNYQPEPGSPLPTVVAADDDTKYSFIGNFMTTASDGTTMTVPQYSYFYAKKGTGNYKFWFYTGSTFAWKSGKCVVERYKLRQGATDKDELFTTTSTDKSAAKQISVFGNDTFGDETTGVEQVEFIMGSDSDAAIYNLNGQAVGNRRANLVKGVYIQNGKKFVVK